MKRSAVFGSERASADEDSSRSLANPDRRLLRAVTPSREPAGRKRLREHVLVVDDDAATRDGLAQLIEQAGYEATAVATFEQARERIRVDRPDLLITDIRLGEYNGLQLILTNPRPIPSIVITGFDDPALQEEARRAGAAYMVKPIRPDELLRLLAQLSEQAARPRRRSAP